jgi:hypothetical protein
MVFPTYREHGVAWCRGVDPISCSACSAASTRAAGTRTSNNFHLYTIVIGSQTLHATGYAMGISGRARSATDDGEAVIAYFGDGATSQGDVNEAFVWPPSTTRRSSSSARTTSGRSPSRSSGRPASRSTSARRLRLPRRPGRRQRRARDCSPSPRALEHARTARARR